MRAYILSGARRCTDGDVIARVVVVEGARAKSTDRAVSLPADDDDDDVSAARGIGRPTTCVVVQWFCLTRDDSANNKNVWCVFVCCIVNEHFHYITIVQSDLVNSNFEGTGRKVRVVQKIDIDTRKKKKYILQCFIQNSIIYLSFFFFFYNTYYFSYRKMYTK